MSAITLVITNAGRAAIVNAQNTGTAPVAIASVGVSNTAVVAAATAVNLPGEIKRIVSFGGDVVADDTIHITVRDDSADAYAMKAFALYLADGTLFALYGQADVIVNKTAGSMMLLSADVKFADIAAGALSFGDTDFLNPPATTEVKGVVELATDAEVAAKTDTTRAVTPKSLWFAFSAWITAQFSDVWRSSNDGSGSGLDADMLDGLHGTSYARRDGTANAALNQAIVVAGNAQTDDIWSGPLCIREVNYGGSAQTASAYAPAITFHWLGVGSAGIKMYGDGHFRFRGQSTSPTDYRNIYAASFYSNGQPVWSAANDGSGSGLDADLLDGQDSGYYTNIAARLGFTPIAATYISDVWRSSNDGSGSGLDADQLDGLHAASFTRRDGTANAPLNQGIMAAGNAPTDDLWSGPICLREVNYVGSTQSASTYAPALTFQWYGAVSGAIKMHFDGSFRFRGEGTDTNTYRNVYAGAFYSNNLTVWNAGNDGSGSGLDADLLDGQDSSFYTNIAARLGFTPIAATYVADVWRSSNDGSGSGLDADMLDGHHAGDFMLASAYTSGGNALSGWRRGPDGFTDQWVRISCNADDEASSPWPRAFTAIMDAQATPIVSASNLDDGAALKTYDNNNFTVIRTAPTGNRENNYIRVRACGYT